MFTKLKQKLARRWLAAELNQLRVDYEKAIEHWKDRSAYIERVMVEQETVIAVKNAMIESLREDADDARKVAHAATQNLCIAVDRLERITEMLPNKASANGTAKKMARTAREAIALIEKEEANV